MYARGTKAPSSRPIGQGSIARGHGQAAAATVSVDLSTRGGATSVVREAIDAVGRIDFLVNNVGAGDPDGLSLGGFLDVDDEQWQAVFDLNLFSAVRSTRAALPSIRERRGSIVDISSINARVPAGSPVGYAEAKAALNQLGKRLSNRCAHPPGDGRAPPQGSHLHRAEARR
ncbi:SDR family NAD(P)-dependent oxidoreductase [Streptomyces sp. DSM 116496]|uniref:SDR family NAD(P)-dependent oxidoreductase n=1 Tax=Streptomyces stoeckheimensis TaxID=3344656 RepID=UPI0038B23944